MSKGTESVDLAFASDAQLRKRVFDAINETPQHAPLFEDIAKYHLASQQFSLANGKSNGPAEQPTKKRRLEDGGVAVDPSQRQVLMEARDISFSLPQRKKLHLSINQYGSDASAPTTRYTICGMHPATGVVEFEHPTTDFEYALRLLVPEKAQKQYNYCLLSKGSLGDFSAALIWTVNVGPLKANQPPSDTIEPGTALGNALDTVLRRAGKKLVTPTESEFVSTLVESHRKTEKTFHVKAFRGSKDGYLYFLENGIFFGFKKPLAFFAFDDIDSISYTAVLQRTFNLVIVARGVSEAETQEIEFSMLDQADFAGIDAYIKKHQLQDSSMADARRAKKFNVNGAKADAVQGGQEDGQTELQKAEQELEDEEDELEEDYDPGSDGESEGSGSSDDDEYESRPSKSRQDLVKEELGSEAEDVEITEDEEEADDAGEDEDEDEQDEVMEVEVDVEEKQRSVAKVIPKPTIPPAPVIQHGAPEIDDEDQL